MKVQNKGRQTGRKEGREIDGGDEERRRTVFF